MITDSSKSFAITNKWLATVFYNLFAIFLIGALYCQLYVYHGDPRWPALVALILIAQFQRHIELKFQRGKAAREIRLWYARLRLRVIVIYLFLLALMFTVSHGYKYGGYFNNLLIIAITFLLLFWLAMAHAPQPKRE
ncbi:MAG: hypothetical protein V4478_03705 [Patescibacteria group bacterium]